MGTRHKPYGNDFVMTLNAPGGLVPCCSYIRVAVTLVLFACLVPLSRTKFSFVVHGRHHGLTRQVVSRDHCWCFGVCLAMPKLN